MSHVQLSSSALERLAARRTFPLHARTGVCRNLFGPVDHDELHREMKDKLREIADMDRQRWNFNFEADSPLEGDYKWEESPRDKTPVFYQDSVQTGNTRAGAAPVKVKPTSDPDPQDTPLVPVGVVPPGFEDRLSGPDGGGGGGGGSGGGGGARGPVEVNQENRTDKLNSGTTRRRLRCARHKSSGTTDTNTTRITDFFVKRRKTAETKASESARRLPRSPAPRKRIR
ncbi:cyclin-dependent kinase inhibitor 1C-like [Lampris incognitus]|uniref:cyclin-dependent kinase inhibitor 1C-like n=1 Tax=Lampris incognitus TaxID=2546036 RepID=UPI0024B4E63B|nr:cyclin-dependent kinase inhibitor 1C-like [Lampris incognitus]